MPRKTSESRRLAALSRSGLLAERSDENFLSLINAASQAFQVPISTISIIDQNRQIYFEKVGIDAAATERDASFCALTVESSAPLVVLDASRDPQWCASALVRDAPHIRFYAGVPLYIDGQPVGTFCIIDNSPRASFPLVDLQRLKHFAAIAGEMLELRSLKAQSDTERNRFRSFGAACSDAMLVTDDEGHVLYWNAGAERLFDYTSKEARHLQANDLLTEKDRTGDNFTTWINGYIGQTREIELTKRNGETFPAEISVSQWFEHTETLFGAIVRDVTGHRKKEMALHLLAHRDSLTGLPNRSAMRLQLEAGLRNGPTAILLVDLDGFKDVNDTIGHAAGDDVLRQAAARLSAAVRDSDTVSRIGGDEFAIVLSGAQASSSASATASRIVAAMEDPFVIEDQTVRIGASVGIAFAPAQAETIDELLLCADLAVYKAKSDGRHRHQLYTPSLRAAVKERQRFVHEFHRAIEQNEFVLHYQPQVRLKTLQLVGAEALIRWQHPEHGLLQPSAFLPALLASRHAVAVNDWVLRTACAQAAKWLKHTAKDFRIGVNACAVRLLSGEISEFTMATLASTGLPPQNLELEITETVMLAHEHACAAALEELRVQGIGIAFDDFGTGYASLSLLEDFPLTRLKIDRSFVRKMNDAPEVPVIRAILQLAKGLELNVIAEGIETEDQLNRLRKKGCAEGQGYLFGRPVTAHEFERTFIHTGHESRYDVKRVA